MISILDKHVIKNIIKGVKEDFDTIEIKGAGSGMFNLCCHRNSFQKYYENGFKVASCICIPKDENDLDDLGVFVHFINIKPDGKGIDYTLGHENKYYNYYLIKKYETVDDLRSWSELYNTRIVIYNKYVTNKIQRLFTKYNII